MAPKTILLSLLAASVVFAAGSSARPGPRPTGPANAAPPAKADQNGNKVFDALESRLAGMSPSDQLAVIVTLKAPATADRVSVLERSVGALGSAERFSIIDGLAATVTKAQVEDLSRLDVVEHVEENSQMRALNDSAQSSFGVTQARLDVPSADGNADGLASYSKNDLVAAVIDTGIDASHLDLDEGKVLAFANCLTNPCTTPAAFDDHGHGTHVAATIAGDGDARGDLKYKGVAPGAALVGVKVLDFNGFGSGAGIIRGIQWAVANKTTYGIEALNLGPVTVLDSDGKAVAAQ